MEYLSSVPMLTSLQNTIGMEDYCKMAGVIRVDYPLCLEFLSRSQF